MSERTKIKIVSRLRGGHIVDTIFIGPENGTLQNAGEIRYGMHQVGQWQLFGTALLMANDSDTALPKMVVVEAHGGEEVIDAIERKQKGE